jgi:hypothetical protein
MYHVTYTATAATLRCGWISLHPTIVVMPTYNFQMRNTDKFASRRNPRDTDKATHGEIQLLNRATESDT